MRGAVSPKLARLCASGGGLFLNGNRFRIEFTQDMAAGGRVSFAGLGGAIANNLLESSGAGHDGSPLATRPPAPACWSRDREEPRYVARGCGPLCPDDSLARGGRVGVRR